MDTIKSMMEAYYSIYVFRMAGIALLLSPSLIAWLLAKRFIPSWKFTAVGIVFGAVALPLSIWFCEQYYLEVVIMPLFEFPWLLMISIHETLLKSLGIKYEYFCMHFGYYIVSGILWGTVYGIIGLLLDKIRLRKKISCQF